MAEKKANQPERLERVYNIPLRKSFRHSVRMRKANKAVRAVKAFLEKHMKSSEVRLGQEINHYIWSRGIRKPPHHVKVFAFKDADGVVKAELEGHKWVEPVRPEKKAETEQGGLAGKLQDLKASASKEETAEETKEESQQSATKTTTKKTTTKTASAKKTDTTKKEAAETSADSKQPSEQPASAKKQE